ncbi:MAG: GNAT family N-acetyltransferase [Myxococcales bacterium]|nr:GNAT family N-acetyltransferase [Myxococcales bacterium]
MPKAPSSGITARLALATDGARISSLLEVFRRELGYTVETTVPLPISHVGPLYCVLAEDHERDDLVVGFLAAYRCHNMVRGVQYVLITDAYVRSEYRRRGVATLLMNEALALGRRLGCQRVSLIVDKNNEGMHATAARAGFTEHSDMLLSCELEGGEAAR